MKKILIVILGITVLTACIGELNESAELLSETKELLWEYKVVNVKGKIANKNAGYNPLVFDDPINILNEMGKERWELVNIYTETATELTNVGKVESVYGIKSNTRTSAINFVFKRPIFENKE